MVFVSTNRRPEHLSLELSQSTASDENGVPHPTKNITNSTLLCQSNSCNTMIKYIMTGPTILFSAAVCPHPETEIKSL
jgi:hypothetical protein